MPFPKYIFCIITIFIIDTLLSTVLLTVRHREEVREDQGSYDHYSLEALHTDINYMDSIRTLCLILICQSIYVVG